MKRSVWLAGGLGLGMAMAGGVGAQVSVGAGAALDLGNGRMDLAGAPLRVEGAMALGAGTVDAAGAVEITLGGVMLGENGTLRTFGDWLNAGVFEPGVSRVSFADGGAGSTSMAGATTFYVLEFLSGVGKTFRLPAGVTQTVQSLLRIRGTPSAPVQMASTAPGSAAMLNLVFAGTQDIAYVGVSDVHATGQWLAAGQQNMGGTGNARRWFGGPGVPPQPVPAGSLVTWLLMAGLMLAAVARAFRHLRRS